MRKQKECFRGADWKKSVLIVDDDAFFRTLLRDIVEKGGYNVVGEAADGVDAVKLAKELKPDVVILDLTMPRKNGIETAMELSKDANAPSIVICTTINDSIIEAADSGAMAYIIKPFNASEVLDALRNL